jgi:hypothetical protein
MQALPILLILAAQGADRPSLAEAMEALQNDLSAAIARGHPGVEDREKWNQINAVLGENIGQESASRSVNDKKLKALMKDVDGLSGKGIFTPTDRAKVERDCETLKSLLKHKYPVYRGYRQGNYEFFR